MSQSLWVVGAMLFGYIVGAAHVLIVSELTHRRYMKSEES